MNDREFLDDLSLKMLASIEHLSSELGSMRTNRAHAGLVSGMNIDYFGSTMKLSELGQISVSDGTMILIQLWDKNAVEMVSKEIESSDTVDGETNRIKSKEKKLNPKGKPTIKLRALDKITAKTEDIQITIGEKEKFGYLEIFPKECSRFKDQNIDGVAAYIQVRDLSDKKDDKVFVFNGWTFSPSTTLRTFDHPVYDLWITGCENI